MEVDDSRLITLPTKAHMREAFSLFDKDGDGCITSSELLTVMCSLGQPATDQEAKDMIRQVDTDGNGLLDFDEFLHMMETRSSAVRRNSPDAEMRALFAAFDKDGNGYIDASEVKSTMRDVGLELTDGDIDVMMKVAGVAIKDRIFYEDFLRMMTGKVGTAEVSAAPENAETTTPQLKTLGYTADDSETQELRIAFSMFDKDGDGRISAQEVRETMQSLGIQIEPSQVKLMVKRVDTNGDGSISFDEFRQVLEKYKLSKTKASCNGVAQTISVGDRSFSEMDLRETFQVFDKDVDGFLSADDLRNTMKQLGLSLSEDDIHAMMRSIGVGPLGKISFVDFCRMFNTAEGNKPSSGDIKVYSRKKLSESFTAEQKKELQAVFSVFDKDRDGFVCMEEVGKVLTSMGINPSEEYIREIFQQVDLDGNNKIDFREFLLLVDKYERPLSEEREMREMFDAIDNDRNGFIDVEELKSTFAGLGVPLSNSDVKQMLKEASIQGTRIFYEDFVQIMMSNIGAAQKQQMSRCSGPPSAASPPCDGVVEVAQIAPQSSSAAPVDDAELRDLRIQFAQFDKDGDGEISPKELCQVMQSLGLQISLEVVKKVLRRADLDRNGRINFAEFCKLMSYHKQSGESEKRVQEQDARQVFRVFDKNRDGYIDETELKQTMQELGVTLSAEDISAMMKKAGCKISGRIYYEEFVRMMFGQMLNPTMASSSSVPDEIVQELRVAFALVDKDGDGRITPRELLCVMTSLGFKSDDVVIKQMIGCFDVDGNGTLEFDEFRDMMKASVDGTTRWEKLKKAHTPPDTWKAFRVFDRNGDGYISKTELYQTMKELGVKLSMEDLNEMMRAADINQDGKIDYAEFSKLMTGAFTSFAKQAAQIHEQKTMFEKVFDQRLSPADLQQAFDEADTNHDGAINVEELEQVAKRLGLNISSSQAKKMIASFGKKECGTISLNDFMMALSRAEHLSVERSRQQRCGDFEAAKREDMRTAFRAFDINNDGFIDASELRATMSDLTGDSLTDEDVDAMIRSADKNGDGRIDYEEFIDMMHSK